MGSGSWEKPPAGEIPPPTPEAIKSIIKHAGEEEEELKAKSRAPTEISKSEEIETIEKLKEVDFSGAESLSQLYKMIREQKEVTHSSGKKMAAEDVIALIKIGGLGGVTRKGNLRETAKRLLLGSFKTAETLKDVCDMLRFRREVKGSVKTYDAEEVIALIKKAQEQQLEGSPAKKEDDAILQIPRTDGLRDKVIDLLG